MDPHRAALLVEDNAFSSRSQNYVSDLVSSSDIHSLDTALHRQHLVDKGKAPERHHNHEEDDDDDGMTWEPPPTEEQANRRRLSGEPGYQQAVFPPFASRTAELATGIELHEQPHLVRQHHGERQHSRSASMSSVESRIRRILWWKKAAVNVLFILSWYLFSTLLSVYNKWMLSADHFDFPYPLFVTSVHMVVQWSLASLTLAAFPHLRPTSRPKTRDYGTKVIPCGMATGLDIGLSNLSLRSITLSFYTMCKSSSLAFVLLFAFLFRLETPSWKLAFIILIITSGVILMVSTETQFDLAGMFEVLTASALGGLRWSLTQILLDRESMGMGNPIATLFWLAPIMGATLATCSMIWDGWGNVFGNERFFGGLGTTLWTLAAVVFPGVLAFLMNITEFGLIQRTSVVTLSVAGIFKEVAVIFLSMFIFHDQLTPINVSGLVVTIFGIALYNYLKYEQFTSGEGGGHGGHGGHSRKPSAPAGFSAVTDDSHGEEEDPMLSPRARHAAHVLGSTSASASIFHDEESASFSAPLHSLGRSPSLSPTSSRSSLSLSSPQAKALQHAHSTIPDLSARLAADPELMELERKEREVERVLEGATEAHREAEDWDLLSGLEEVPAGKRDV